ncbi:alpha/beta fold hydrolase [soil metagenome]
MPFAYSAGTRIHYQVEGSGPPLFLHIGFMGRVEGWYQAGYVEALQSDYQLILLDPRGQGRSETPHDPDDYTLAKRVEDVISVLDDIGTPKAHFLGYSMGGLIGFGIGAYAPKRLASLIIGGSNAFEQVAWSEDYIALLRQGMPAFVEAWEQEHGLAPPAAREHWLQCDGKALAANLVAQRHYPNLAEHLPTITLPSLLYSGTEDDIYAEVKRAAEDMPNASFVALDSLDHLTAFRNGVQLLAPHIRAFLNDTDVSL